MISGEISKKNVFRPKRGFLSNGGIEKKNISGTNLNLGRTRHSIIISDRNDNGLYFSASIGDFGLEKQTIPNMLSFGIRNPKIKNSKTDEHEQPDIHTKKFVRLSIEYLETMNPKINGIIGDWDASSTNYDEFFINLAKMGKIDRESILEAAKNTWTGRVASDLKYKNVEMPIGQEKEFEIRKKMVFAPTQVVFFFTKKPIELN